MTSPQPIDDIIKWSEQKLQRWHRDALRRLACGGALGAGDQADLLAMVKQKAGLAVVSAPPEPVPLAKSHFSGAVAGAPLKLVAVRDVQNVNRLAPAARIDFSPEGLTVVYGRNGSGKSGFVRILRTACRTRIESTAKLKVLSNVYGGLGGPQAAVIVIDAGAGEIAIPWDSDGAHAEQLLQVAVFDSLAAELYVDQGHQIRFLPFGLALPHKLNELCLALRAALEAERAAVTQKLALAVVQFDQARETKAQVFYRGLTGKTTDAAIGAAAAFAPADADRLTVIRGQLAADPGSSADVSGLAAWVEKLGEECAAQAEALSDSGLAKLQALADQARDKREAASLDAEALFKDEPLPGVGAGAWRALWKAARDYSVDAAYVGEEFPVVKTATAPASCVLCHQPLDAAAAARLQRFKAFVDGALAAAADQAEAAAVAALEDLPPLALLDGGEWSARIEQLAARDAVLSDRAKVFRDSALARRERAETILSGVDASAELAPLADPSPDLAGAAAKLRTEAEARAAAGDDGVRTKMLAELGELADRKLLAGVVGRLKVRRDLLREDAAYQVALKEVQTKAITEAANKFVDDHLTTKVVERFDGERKILEIDHLNIGLARKSGQTKASFHTDPGTTFTKNASEILSEGEQRALALSAFLTEVAMTDGSGPVVIDDPVSSLDRERCVKVAMRLAAEAQGRQVVVFTHDLVFFNDLCREAEALDVAVVPVSLFANKVDAGKVDPAGVTWKGLPVKRRLNLIKSEFGPVKALHGVSAADYEFKVKGLYGRLRDTYERAVEECIFRDVVTRGADRVETLKLRYVHLSDGLAIRFHEGMTRANTYSHDNPAAETVETPEPDEFEKDLLHLEKLIADLDAESKDAEGRRPAMKPKK
ncbi:AAA family ATPase [Caulobacter sp. KR2-114]|uniref:AAA family ATPase n=1 Tax=Caulobacter sp. KR2-114 TaxID=3400912 RepID=UPI003C0A6742